MTPDTMQRLAAELRRERLREAEHERLAATCRPRRTRTLTPLFGATVGHLLATHRRPAPR